MHNDDYWMRAALKLARKGAGLTSPNPTVGAVIISGNKLVGQGYHRFAGGPHAEIAALKSAGNRSKGATLYVTLEPCSTMGKTPPCTDAIIKSGLRKVVMACRDPNPKHAGRGISILKRAGITVKEGVCREEALNMIRPFSKWITSGLPYLTLKMGITIDGKIADESGKSKWITCAESRKAVHAVRSRVDAIMIGSGTAVMDNPSLVPAGRNGAGRAAPWRVIIDSAGKLTGNERVLNDKFANRTIIATTRLCPARKFKNYQTKGATVWILPAVQSGVSLPALMKKLGKDGVLHVLCEGGGTLAYSLIKSGMVDEYMFFVAPLVIGGKASVSAVGGNGWKLDSAPRLKFSDVARTGSDIMIRAFPES